MVTAPILPRTPATLDHQPERLPAHVARTGEIGARPPTAHPDQRRQTITV